MTMTPEIELKVIERAEKIIENRIGQITYGTFIAILVGGVTLFASVYTFVNNVIQYRVEEAIKLTIQNQKELFSNAQKQYSEALSEAMFLTRENLEKARNAKTDFDTAEPALRATIRSFDELQPRMREINTAVENTTTLLNSVEKTIKSTSSVQELLSIITSFKGKDGKNTLLSLYNTANDKYTMLDAKVNANKAEVNKLLSRYVKNDNLSDNFKLIEDNSVKNQTSTRIPCSSGRVISGYCETDCKECRLLAMGADTYKSWSCKYDQVASRIYIKALCTKT